MSRTEPARRWAHYVTAVALVAPVLVATASVVVLLLVASALPARVLVHWGPGGAETGSPYAAAIALPISLVLALVTWAALKDGGGARARVGVAGPVAIACFVSVTLVGTAVLQVRPGAPVPGVPLLAGLALGAVAGVLAAAAAPTPPARGPAPAIVPQQPLAAAERLVWLGRATASPVLLAAVIGALAVLATVVLLAGLAGGSPAGWSALLPLVLALVVVSTLSWRVRIDEAGVVARGALGFPVVRAPLREVEAVEVRMVSAIGDRGGFGLRFGGGATAVVTRSGEALRVVRRRGRPLEITVDHAAEAAGALQALVDRTSRAHA